MKRKYNHTACRMTSDGNWWRANEIVVIRHHSCECEARQSFRVNSSLRIGRGRDREANRRHPWPRPIFIQDNRAVAPRCPAAEVRADVLVRRTRRRTSVSALHAGSRSAKTLTRATTSLSHKQRAVNRAMELRFDHKSADCSCGARWRSCSDCRAEAAKKKAEQLERAYPGISTLWRDGAS